MRLEKGWYKKSTNPYCLDCGQRMRSHPYIEGRGWPCPKFSGRILGLSIEEIKRIANVQS